MAGIEERAPTVSETAVYGTVRTVVWEDGAAIQPPLLPDCDVGSLAYAGGRL